ncbi:MAG: alkaline phosphatase family protein [Thermoplasmata archaeon]|nr:alkaline phosphatase family protein [Thermoplasmata archaeon]
MTGTPSPRFLVLGLDGATFDLIDPMIRAGKLPFLARLAANGLTAPLRSVYPPKTIPAWYSFATGLDPGALGIFGFTEPNGGPGKSRLVQTFRPAEAVWDTLSRQGKKVGVVNFPLRSGYPLHGFVVPGMLTERPETYPADLLAAIEKDLGEPLLTELPPYQEAQREQWIAHATRHVEQCGRMAEFLCQRGAPDFLFVLFRETDRLQHQLWHELAKDPASWPPELSRFWEAVDSACARIETAFQHGDTNAITIVISDHGHGAALSDFFTNRWLQQEGYLVLKDEAGGLRRRIVAPLLVKLAGVPGASSILRKLADRLQGSPGRERMGQLLTGTGSFESMASHIDWEKTVAYSYPVPEGIYLNRYNPNLTSERKAALRREIRDKLTAYPEARIEVFDPLEIYRGRNFQQAPDLLLRVDGLATELRMDFSYPAPMLRQRPAYFYGSGVHRMDGILFASGGGSPTLRLEDPLSLLDVCPTVLDGMNVASSPDLSGRSFLARLIPKRPKSVPAG